MKIAPFRKNRFADRGKQAEDAVQDYLKGWASRDVHRDFERLVDTKAAGRTIKAAAADFAFFCDLPLGHVSGYIEVKETKHDYRLGKDRLTQLPRLRKRAKCGCAVFVLVFHSEIARWRCMTMAVIDGPSDTGSWNIKDLPMFATPGEALAAASTTLMFDREVA